MKSDKRSMIWKQKNAFSQKMRRSLSIHDLVKQDEHKCMEINEIDDLGSEKITSIIDKVRREKENKS